MKRILCYGDSNTWGFNPITFSENYSYYVRYTENVRWTSILQKMLGGDYTVIEEGLGGRTTVLDDPISQQQLNGKKYLLPCLGSHAPIDLVVIMLGINDLKNYYQMSAHAISAGIELLVKIIQSTNFGVNGKSPEILILSPALITNDIAHSCINFEFDVPEAIERCKELPELYQNVAQRNSCHFLNCDDYVELSPIDFVHYTELGHERLAKGIYDKIIAIYSKD